MALNFVFVGDYLQTPLCSTNTGDVSDIYQYIVSSGLTYYDNNCFQSWCDTKTNHHIIVPKSTHLLRFYQRILPATNVVVLFVNINEQNNYSFKMLQEWKVSLHSKLNPQNPQHPNKSHQLFQSVIIGISHFVYPPKYICIVLCGAVSRLQFTEKRQFIIETYSDIIFKKCQMPKNTVLFIEDLAFTENTTIEPKKLIHRIKESLYKNAAHLIPNIKTESELLLISIYGQHMIKTQDTFYTEFILCCSILNGSISLNDRLILYPMNIGVDIIDMRLNTGETITSAHTNNKISVKIRINAKQSSVWNRKWLRNKHFLLSKAARDAFKWKHVYSHSDEVIEIKLYLSSRYNYKKGIFRNQQLLISYLGHRYAVNVLDFIAAPSVDTILECRAIYDVVYSTYNCQLSNDCVRIIIEYVLTSTELKSKIGLLQKKSMHIIIEPLRSISFSTMKTWNKFCVLAQNEIVAKGKFVASSKCVSINLDATEFDLTQKEKDCILKWIPNIRKYKTIQLKHRGSLHGFDNRTFRYNCNIGPYNYSEKLILIIIKAKKSGNIFGVFLSYMRRKIHKIYSMEQEAPSFHSFMFQLRLNYYDDDECEYIESNIAPTKWRLNTIYKLIYTHSIDSVYFGDKESGLCLVDGCDINKCRLMRNSTGSDFEMISYDDNDTLLSDVNKLMQREFLVQDYEVWQLRK